MKRWFIQERGGMPKEVTEQEYGKRIQQEISFASEEIFNHVVNELSGHENALNGTKHIFWSEYYSGRFPPEVRNQ